MLPRYIKKEIQTERLAISYLETGSPEKETLILVHGNTSSNLFYLPTMKALEDSFHIYAPDLRGYGYTEHLPIDATGGMKEWSLDLRSFILALKIVDPHIIGWSMGGGVVMQYLLDYENEVKSIGLINPLSPYGFSGTHGTEGIPNNESHSGTGAGLVNRAFVESLRNKNMSKDDAFSAPNVLKGLFAPGYNLPEEWSEVFVESMFLMALGDDFYPGDAALCREWPAVGPGTRGIGNTMSPKYVNLSRLTTLEKKPPIIWFRGAKDKIVSDTSSSDIGFLGQLGFVPGWPGNEVYPPQPMVSQTRDVLTTYGENGGIFVEAVFENSGHSPQIEEAPKFVDEYKRFVEHHTR